jgi:hypothetical protein
VVGVFRERARHRPLLGRAVAGPFLVYVSEKRGGQSYTQNHMVEAVMRRCGGGDGATLGVDDEVVRFDPDLGQHRPQQVCLGCTVRRASEYSNTAVAFSS